MFESFFVDIIGGRMYCKEVSIVSANNLLIPTVERNRMPLVTRRVGVQDYQPQKEKDQSGQFGSDRKQSDKHRGNPAKPNGCVISSYHRIDCRA